MKLVRLGLVPKALGNSAFELARIGAEEAASELDGTELLFDGPILPTANGQIDTVNDLIARGIHALAVNPNDPNALMPCLDAAERRGVRVLTWDAGIRPKGRFMHICPCRDDALASVWLRLLQDAVDHSPANFAILSTTDVAPNQNRWIAAIRRQLSTGKYGELSLCDVLFGHDIADKSRAEVRKRLDADPGLKGILALGGVGLVAAAEAIEASGKAGTVFATGLGYPSEIEPFIERGVVRSFAVWSMIDLGYTAFHFAHALATGKLEAREGVGTEVGRLGRMRIDGGMEVIMTEPCVYDAANVHTAARVF